MSQETLAGHMGVNQTAVSQWERSVVLPSYDKLPDLAAALGCEIADLFTRDPPKIVEGSQERGATNDFQKSI